jgi:hypothetical protein
MLYKVFVDDSGSREYRSPYAPEFVKNPPSFEDYPQFWRDNYFVLCAVRIHYSDLGDINLRINGLKEKYFKTKKVEIKSDWLRNPNKRRKHYIKKFNITKESLKDFVDELYNLIRDFSDKLKIIGIVFDKRFYGDNKRKTADGDPLVKCAQVLFERLQYLNTYHIVVFDQFEHHLQLRSRGQHRRILNVIQNKGGLQKVYVDRYDKIIDIKFSKSRDENFIQIADLCAYNIYRQFVHYGRQWQKQAEKDQMQLYPFFDKIRCNFIYDTKTQRVVGRGLICIPDIGKCNWNLLDGCNI